MENQVVSFKVIPEEPGAEPGAEPGSGSGSGSAAVSGAAAVSGSTTVSVSSLNPQRKPATASAASRQGSPEARAGVVSRLLFYWVGSIFRASSARRRAGGVLEKDDLWALARQDQSSELLARFSERWEQRAKLSPSARLSRALWLGVWGQMSWASLWKLVEVAQTLSSPLLINKVLLSVTWASSGSPEYVDASGGWPVACVTGANATAAAPALPPCGAAAVPAGYLWAGVYALALLAGTLAKQQFLLKTTRARWHIKTTVISAVYRKTLLLSGTARGETTQGEIVNLMQVDAARIAGAVYVIELGAGFLVVGGLMAQLYFILSYAAFVCLGVLVMSVPLSNKYWGLLDSVYEPLSEAQDARASMMKELLQGILWVKMAALEARYGQVVAKLRDVELGHVRKLQTIETIGWALTESVPMVAAAAALACYALTTEASEQFSATLFTALVATSGLLGPLVSLSTAVSIFSAAGVGRTRVARFLALPGAASAPRGGDGAYAVRVEDGEFYWARPETPRSGKPDSSKSSSSSVSSSSSSGGGGGGKSDVERGEGPAGPARPALSGVNLKVANGALVGVAGPVGSGKSSLLSAMLGELYASRGSVNVRDGQMAYAAQTAWILNMSVRDNILFGAPFEEKRYKDVLRACQLTTDLAQLPGGDQTMIGERGVNLSGGQKQRVAIARAAYSTLPVVLLDDPLSALDPGVAAKVFEQCICRLMRGRTRVLVTNALQFLPSCDQVIVMDQGRVLLDQARGATPQPGKRASRGYASLVQQFAAQDRGAAAAGAGAGTGTGAGAGTGADDDSEGDGAKAPEIGQQMVQEEDREQGAVAFKTYWAYVAAGGGLCMLALLLLGVVAEASAPLGQTAWLTLWGGDAQQSPPYQDRSLVTYLVGLAVSALLIVLAMLLSGAVKIELSMRASRKLHERLLTSVLRAPMRFFETTPTGRVLNRFTGDLNNVDTEGSGALTSFFQALVAVAFSLAAIAFVTPLFLPLVPVLAPVYLLLAFAYRAVNRDAKRLQAIARSPIIAHLSETLTGLPTIRAFGAQRAFGATSIGLVDDSSRATYLFDVLSMWVSLRLDLVANVIAVAAAVLAVHGSLAGTLSPQLAGFAMVNALAVTWQLGMLMRAYTGLEAEMVATERVVHYATQLEQEEPTASAGARQRRKLAALPAGWPSAGAVEVRGLSLRYRHDTPLVLRGVTFSIRPGARIGVVGRTGSGKSSLIVALLRIAEPERSGEEGPIKIDGVDTSKIPLRALRAAISVLPQNPVIFSGTVRSNIDPFGLHSVQIIDEALTRVGLAGKLSASSTVDEYGANLSQGERQLLALAKATLAKSRIVLFDEHSSSLDAITDATMQRMIRAAFAGSTMITIAHRLATVIDSDKIVVMEKGEAVEFAAPELLLADSASRFSRMLNELGPDMAASLRAAAAQR